MRLKFLLLPLLLWFSFKIEKKNRIHFVALHEKDKEIKKKRKIPTIDKNTWQLYYLNMQTVFCFCCCCCCCRCCFFVYKLPFHDHFYNKSWTTHFTIEPTKESNIIPSELEICCIYLDILNINFVSLENYGYQFTVSKVINVPLVMYLIRTSTSYTLMI